MRVSSATEHEHLVHDARSVNLEGFAARYLNDSQAVEMLKRGLHGRAQYGVSFVVECEGLGLHRWAQSARVGAVHSTRGAAPASCLNACVITVDTPALRANL